MTTKEPPLNLPIDNDQLRIIVSKAIIDALTPEQKALMVAQALEYLMKPRDGSWSNRDTPLQQAFNNAVENVLREEAHKFVKEDPQFRAKITELLNKAFQKFMEQDTEALALDISSSIGSWLRREAKGY